MDKSQIIALSINILKLTPGTLARNVQIPKVDPCLLCGEELLSNSSDPIKEFTLASCGHIFHQKCLEKHLVNGRVICPNKECNKDIETSLTSDFSNNQRNEKNGEMSTKVNPDETNTTATTTTTTVIQVDSENLTPVDDPLESESRIEAQLSGSTKTSLDQAHETDLGKGDEDNPPEVSEEQSEHEQEMDVDNTGDAGEDENEDEDEVEVQVDPDTTRKKRANTSIDNPLFSYHPVSKKSIKSSIRPIL